MSMQAKFEINPIAAAVTALVAAGVLVACGGGGGSSTSLLPGTTVTTTTLPANALLNASVSGSPFLSGTVRLTCADGTTTANGTIGTDSTYTVTPPSGCGAPFLVEVLTGDMRPIGGDTPIKFDPSTYFPLRAYVNANDENKGINPITSVVAAQAGAPGSATTLDVVNNAKNKVADAVGLSATDLGKDYATQPALLPLATALVQVIQTGAKDNNKSLAEVTNEMGRGLTVANTVGAESSMGVTTKLDLGTALNNVLLPSGFQAISTTAIDDVVTTMKNLAVDISDQKTSKPLKLADLASTDLGSQLSECAVGSSTKAGCDALTAVLKTNAGNTINTLANNAIDFQVSKMAYDAKNSISTTDIAATGKKNAIDYAVDQQRKTLNDAFTAASSTENKLLVNAQAQAAVQSASTMLNALAKDSTATATKVLVDSVAITSSAVKAAQTQVTNVADLLDTAKTTAINTSMANATAALNGFVMPPSVGSISLTGGSTTDAVKIEAVLLAVAETTKSVTSITPLTQNQIDNVKKAAQDLTTASNTALTGLTPPVPGATSIDIANWAKQFEGNVQKALDPTNRGTDNFDTPPTIGAVSTLTTTTPAPTTTTTSSTTTTTGRGATNILPPCDPFAAPPVPGAVKTCIVTTTSSTAAPTTTTSTTAPTSSTTSTTAPTTSTTSTTASTTLPPCDPLAPPPAAGSTPTCVVTSTTTSTAKPTTTTTSTAAPTTSTTSTTAPTSSTTSTAAPTTSTTSTAAPTTSTTSTTAPTSSTTTTTTTTTLPSTPLSLAGNLTIPFDSKAGVGTNDALNAATYTGSAIQFGPYKISGLSAAASVTLPGNAGLQTYTTFSVNGSGYTSTSTVNEGDLISLKFDLTHYISEFNNGPLAYATNLQPKIKVGTPVITFSILMCGDPAVPPSQGNVQCK